VIYSYANTLLVTFNNRAFVNNGVGRNLTQQTPSFSETTYPRPTAPMTFAPNPNRVLVTTSKVTDDISLNRLEVRALSLSLSRSVLLMPASAGFFQRQADFRLERPSRILNAEFYDRHTALHLIYTLLSWVRRLRFDHRTPFHSFDQHYGLIYPLLYWVSNSIRVFVVI
jgi:hypothetical protein